MKNVGARQCKSQSGNPAGDSPVRHTLVLFGGIVPRKASAHLRDLLTTPKPFCWLRTPPRRYSAPRRWRQTGADRMAGERLAPFLDEAQRKNRRIFQTFCRYPSFAGGGRAEKRRSASGGRRCRDQLPRLSRDIDSMLLLAGAYGDAVAPGWKTGRNFSVPLSMTTAAYLNISVARRWPQSRSGCTVENDNFRPGAPMMPLSSQLQQHWQTVADRLPADFPFQR
jgi:triphosphatase